MPPQAMNSTAPSKGDDKDQLLEPLQRTKRDRWMAHLRSLYPLVWPVVATKLCNWSTFFISLIFAGHLGAEQLGGAALGNLIVNVTGWSVGQGLLTALETLASQAFGAQYYARVGVLSLRGLLVVMCWIPFIVPLWLFTEPFLVALSQPAEVSYFAGIYTRITLIGMPFLFACETMALFLQAQGLTSPMLHVDFASNVLHILWCYLLVFQHDLGFIGVAWANVITLCLRAVGILLYIKVLKPHKPETWTGFHFRRALRWSGLREFITIGVPGCIMLCLEWSSFEVVSLFAGGLGTTSLGVHNVLASIVPISFSFAEGFMVAVNIRVNHLLGIGDETSAREVAKVAMASGLLLTSCLGAFLLILGQAGGLGPIFTSDPDVQAGVRQLSPFLPSFLLVDAVQGIRQSIVRSVGMQKLGTYITVIGYYFVSIPMAYALTYPAGLGIIGLWLGLMMGYATVGALYTAASYRIDWVQARYLAQDRAVEEKRRTKLSASASMASLSSEELAALAQLARSDDSRLSRATTQTSGGSTLSLQSVELAYSSAAAGETTRYASVDADAAPLGTTLTAHEVALERLLSSGQGGDVSLLVGSQGVVVNCVSEPLAAASAKFRSMQIADSDSPPMAQGSDQPRGREVVLADTDQRTLADALLFVYTGRLSASASHAALHRSDPTCSKHYDSLVDLSSRLGLTALQARLLSIGLASDEEHQRLKKCHQSHILSAGRTVVMMAAAGDTFSLINLQGLQPAQVVVLPPPSDGKAEDGELPLASAATIGLVTQARPLRHTQLWSDVLTDQRSAATLAPVLPLTDPGAICLVATVFDSTCLADHTVSFSVSAPCILAFSNVALPAMQPHQQQPSTPIALLVRRNRAVSEPAPKPSLPHMLASGVAAAAEYTVPAGHCRSYRVRAGDYIQVVSVSGMQQSDMMVFRANTHGQAAMSEATTRKINRQWSEETEEDAGLPPVIYAADGTPLLELVQDTFGRHGLFGVACTASHSDSVSACPLHSVCSSAVQDQLALVAVDDEAEFRPALNLFRNTMFDTPHQLLVGAPAAAAAGDVWCRAGDFVVFRALADLECANTARADDHTAAGGWQATDVLVRVYPAGANLKKSIVRKRKLVSAPAIPSYPKPTAFHPFVSEMCDSFCEVCGSWAPLEYRDYGLAREYSATREGVIVMDFSFLLKFEITGSDATELMQYALTRDIRGLKVGQIAYCAMCDDAGCVQDDGTVFRMGDNAWRWAGEHDQGPWLQQLARRRGFQVHVRSSSDELHSLQIQGPRSRELMERVVWTPDKQVGVADLPYFRFTTGYIGGQEGALVLISRTGFTGELGFEIWCHPLSARAVWTALWEQGHKDGFDLVPLGLGALDVVRIEAGLIGADSEYIGQTNPFESGIGFVVPTNKKDDWVGSEAIASARENPTHTLVGLEFAAIGENAVAKGDLVHADGKAVGEITSCCESIALKKPIAFARIAVQHAGIGSEVEVGEALYSARVVRFPFVDPEKKRPRTPRSMAPSPTTGSPAVSFGRSPSLISLTPLASVAETDGSAAQKGTRFTFNL